MTRSAPPDNETVLRRFIEQVWNTGDLDAVDAFIAQKYTVHSDPGDPWDGKTLDRDAFRFRLAASREPFPDLAFTLDELVAADDRVAASWTMRGTQLASMGELEASESAIEVRGITIYYFDRGGRITGHRQVVDRLAVVQQLGLLGP